LSSFKSENLERDLENENKVKIVINFDKDNSNGDNDRRINLKKIISFPFNEIRLKEKEVRKNIIAFGILCSLFNFPQEIGKKCIKNKFRNKSNSVNKVNLSSYNIGYNWTQEINFDFKLGLKTLNETNDDDYILDGNQLLSIGALEAGCRFYSSYPITPATSIGDFFGKHIVKLGGYAYQAEDEIAALATVIGSSFNGVKSMTATSGPGLSLMQELIGFASMVELPVVIVDVQRGGPSTGMPTKHEQSDLLAAVFGSHGDSPRIIIAPNNLEENYNLIIEAFNLAERYQCPVIFLSDASLAMIESNIAFNKLKKPKIIFRKMSNQSDYHKFLRYKITDSGVGEFLIPGDSSLTYNITGVEHNEDSSPDLNPKNRIKQMDKRFSKFINIEKDNSNLIEWDIHNKAANEKYDISIISWGLSASITKESVSRLRKSGYKIAALYLKLVYPICEKSINEVISLSNILFIPETNYTGQLAKLIKMNINIEVHSFLKSTGEPFTPEEIEKEIIQILNNERS